MGRKKIKQDSEKKSRRAALYCRVSTFDQNRGDYSSLEDQETRLRRAAEAEGYEVYQVFREVASSASLERDELRRLLGKLDEIDAVFVTKLDRLSRSMHDWCRLNELFDKYNVALVSTTQKIDTTTPMGRFFRDLLMLFAQFEREMIAERTYEKMAEQARQGRWGGGHPILGYDVVNKRLVVNPAEAAVVLAIYKKYLEVGSLSRAARWSNHQGYRTKGITYSSGREVSPRKFTRADVQRLLTNILYIGKVRFDEVNYQAEHETIVPEDLFWEVQNLLAAKKEKPRRGDQTQQDTLLLGLLRCGFCGSAYTSSFVNKKDKDGKPRRYYYYKCTRKSKHEAAACPAADLRADIIDEAFVKFFRDLSQEPDRLAGVIKAAEDSSKKGCGTIEKERNRLSSELAKTERQAMALVGRLEDPELSQLDAIKFRLAELNAQQQALKAQITDLTLQLRDRRDQSLSLEEVREAYQQFEELWDELTFAEKQYAVRLLVRQVELLFRRGEKTGQIKIEAWGRSPTPLTVRLHDFRERKLRNQDVWLPD